ncbi:MAG TPA: Maf family protein [Terriglobales bacterium]|jgi:septum formation protein|nr:Maf family protein [Terriglobales bacterium]
MPLVLASASPRRQELLKNAGIEFVLKPANIPEVRLDQESAQVFAERMAREKARAVFAGAKGEYVLGADTVVVVAEMAGGATGVSPVEVQLVLGKPESEEDAARMLRLISGRKHQVITGVCLIGSGFEDVRSETTTVEFSALSETEIRDYIATGEPMDKAGAYAIQGAASRWVLNVKGDYSNVVGLPVALVLQILRDHRLDKS